MSFGFPCWLRGSVVILSLGWVGYASSGAGLAAPPTDQETRARIVGQPTALIVEPATIVLDGPRGTVQPVISGRYADSSLRDLTHFCEVSMEDAGVAHIDAERFVLPRKDGTTTLVVRAGGQTVRVPVTVRVASRSA